MEWDRMKILIVGGYGVFGGRIVDLLSDRISLTIVVAGRSLQKATEFCLARTTSARLVPAFFDRRQDNEARIRTIAPDVVVDASGPFQHYGDDPYALARAAISCGCTYLDLADGAEFASGISVLNEEAKRRGVAILSGVSSFPVLTAAVVRSLSYDMTSVAAVTGGIAPSPLAGVGINVVSAVASYAGRPLALRRDGKDGIGYGLAEYRHWTVSPPGLVPLRPLRFSLVDVPDLKAIPELWPEVASVWMGAAPVPQMLHRALNWLAGLVRVGILPGLSGLAPVIHEAMRLFARGEHRGGMFVVVDGKDARGASVRRSWHLVAEGDDGPLIPSMAVEALVLRMLDGRFPEPGARTATGELELEDYEALFADRTIRMGTRLDSAPSQGVFPDILGSAFDTLPTALKGLHSGGMRRYVGIAEVERGVGRIASLVAHAFGFPDAGRSIPVQVMVESDDRGERWTRRFAGRSFESFLSKGRGRDEALVTETFGAFTFGIALVADGEGLRFVQRTWSVFGIPLPIFIMPGGPASETQDRNGNFHFDVDIGLPIIGRVVRYAGSLRPMGSGEEA
jgi:hypothetical protein